MNQEKALEKFAQTIGHHAPDGMRCNPPGLERAKNILKSLLDVRNEIGNESMRFAIVDHCEITPNATFRIEANSINVFAGESADKFKQAMELTDSITVKLVGDKVCLDCVIFNLYEAEEN